MLGIASNVYEDEIRVGRDKKEIHFSQRLVDKSLFLISFVYPFFGPTPVGQGPQTQWPQPGD